MEDLRGEAVILLVSSQVSNNCRYSWVCWVAVFTSGCWEMRLMSSAQVITLVDWLVGVGRSAVKRLKRNEERMAPCGTPFCSLMECERVFLWRTLAYLLVRKFESHFLSLFSRGD